MVQFQHIFFAKVPVHTSIRVLPGKDSSLFGKVRFQQILCKELLLCRLLGSLAKECLRICWLYL
jgi:hypothetical protein